MTDVKRVIPKLAEVRSVRFDLRKACRRLAELWRHVLTTSQRVSGLQRFGACRMLVEVRRVRFDNRKAWRRLAVLSRMRFDHRKAC